MAPIRTCQIRSAIQPPALLSLTPPPKRACPVLVVHAAALVDAEDELFLAAVVPLQRRDQHLREPQPREDGSNSGSVFDFRVLKRVQRQFPSAETAQNWTILEDPGISSHPEPELSNFSKSNEAPHCTDKREEGSMAIRSHIRPLKGRKDNARPHCAEPRGCRLAPKKMYVEKCYLSHEKKNKTAVLVTLANFQVSNLRRPTTTFFGAWPLERSSAPRLWSACAPVPSNTPRPG